MNRPNDNTLERWLEGELEGEELLEVDAWAESHAGDLDEEFKCEIGWSALDDDFLASLPDTEEPPYPDFFNSKIQQAISEGVVQEDVGGESGSSLWRNLRLVILPAAVAAMVAFYAGTKMQGVDEGVDEGVDDAVASVENSVYVPHSGIVADVSESVDATEIVLSGLAPISDNLDIAAGETSPGDSPMMANTQAEITPLTIF